MLIKTRITKLQLQGFDDNHEENLDLEEGYISFLGFFVAIAIPVLNKVLSKVMQNLADYEKYCSRTEKIVSQTKWTTFALFINRQSLYHGLTGI